MAIPFLCNFSLRPKYPCFTLILLSITLPIPTKRKALPLGLHLPPLRFRSSEAVADATPSRSPARSRAVSGCRVNISLGPNEDRMLNSGLHTVNDIYCSCCQQMLGWRYEKAYEPSEKYKEGKYILEKARILKEGW